MATIADVAPPYAPARRDRLIAVALALTTFVLYGWRLEYSPIHLHYDEIFFGLQGQSIQATGRDLNGLRLPVYFQLESSVNWYQPIGVYWTALVLYLLPLSDAAIRTPTVLVGVIDVVLMFFVARALFRHTGWAVVAALLLMLTPAHYIHSRLAMDYIYPLPFLLGWTWSMLRYLERPSSAAVFAGASSLGLCCFSYIAGTALAPMFLAAMLIVLWLQDDTRRLPIAVAAFAWPLVAAAIFLAAHPDVVPHLMGKYGVSLGPESGLDPVQRLRERVTGNTVSDALNHYWRFFSPGYLFVTGGSNLTNSTRTTGVFLPPLAILLAAGMWRCLAAWRTAGVLLLFAFFVAAVPAAMMPEDFTIDRELAKVPFAILIATIGAHWLWRLPATRSVGVTIRNLAGTAAFLVAAYGVVSLVARGRVGATVPLLFAAVAGLCAIGMAIDRRRNGSPVVAGLLLSVAVLFGPFVADYFDGYRLRSSGWFGGNIRGAVEEVMRIEAPAPEIHLSTDIPYIRSYWTFYQLVHGREDLKARTRIFDGRTLDLSTIPRGSLLLAAANDPVTNALAASGELTPTAAIGDPGGHGQFVIFSR